jgi:hypothetical protein
MWVAVALSLMAELFEAIWQRSDTLRGALDQGYHYYRRSIFLFLAMHVGYWLTLFLSLKYNLLNWPIIGILAFKTMDIFFKIDMIGRIHGRGELSREMEGMLDSSIPKWYFFAGAFTYPYFIYLAFAITR